MDCCLYFPLPMYMEGAPLLDVMKIDLSLLGTVPSFADAAREVDVGGGDLDAISLLLDPHDAVQRVLSRFGLFLMASEVYNLLLMLVQKPAM